MNLGNYSKCDGMTTAVQTRGNGSLITRSL